MRSKPTDPDALSITIAKDGTASLSGINYDDLRSILTAADLYRGSDIFKPEIPGDGRFSSLTHHSNIESYHWRLRQRFLIDVLDGRMADAISPQYPSGKVEAAKRTYTYNIAHIEETVTEAEVKAAAEPVTIDPIVEISDILSKALRDADGAVAKLNRLKAKL
jgi:hypothetical protein